MRRRATKVALVISMAFATALVSACGTTSNDTGSRPALGSTAATAGSSTAPGTTVAPRRGSPGCAAGPDAGPAGTTVTPGALSLDIGGTTRTYRLSVPATASVATRAPGLVATPAPLILLFHGLGSSAEDIDRVSDLPQRAALQGTIVVTPDATGAQKVWQSAAHGADADFVDALIDQVEKTQCIDLDRVTLAGFSAGAAFTGAYACARQDKIAAIVTVAVEFPGGCTKPMPILSFHGTADPIVAFATPDPAAPGVVHGTVANMTEWAKVSTCNADPTTTVIGTEVTKLAWTGCAACSDIVLYEIIGGGHAWPGKDPATSVTPATQQISATDQALVFFAAHPLSR